MPPRPRISPFYDKEAAKRLIEELSQQRKDAIRSAICLSHDEESQLTVLEEQNPRFLKIVHDGTDLEATFRMIGVVTSVDMDYPSQYDSTDDIRHKAQHIKLVGFGAESFTKSLANVEKLYWQIHRNMATKSMKPMPISRFQNHPQIHFKCCFFTTGKDAEHTENVRPAEHVDASGIISYFLQDSTVRHGETNRVVYRKLGAAGYANIPPASIGPGDIAEVEFSVLGAPSLRDGGNFILIQSRVTILNEALSMKAFMAQCKMDSQGPTTGPTSSRVRAKRRPMDDEQEVDSVEAARVKIAKLDVC